MALSTAPKLNQANPWVTIPNRNARPRIPIAAAAEFEEGLLERPKWSGETPLSRLVGALISFKPLYSVLKLGARQVLISTAEKTNIPWRDMANEILDSDVYKEKDAIEDSSIVYPDYYLNPFHAYDEGNLSWLAAAEAEAATMSMVRRCIPHASSFDEANQLVRGNWLQAIENHHKQYSTIGDSTIRDILDVGCSVGVSTRILANKFPLAKVTGLDLSPYFVAVALYKERTKTQRKQSIRWIHGNGENTGLTSKSFDLVSIAYVFHECPERAIKNMVQEAFRLLRSGGTLAVTDNSPKSKILQATYSPLSVRTITKTTLINHARSRSFPEIASTLGLISFRFIVFKFPFYPHLRTRSENSATSSEVLDPSGDDEFSKELSPVLFTLMKSTEPFLDEYYLTDLEEMMKQVGFVHVKAVLTDPRHRTITATVPY